MIRSRFLLQSLWAADSASRRLLAIASLTLTRQCRTEKYQVQNLQLKAFKTSNFRVLKGINIETRSRFCSSTRRAARCTNDCIGCGSKHFAAKLVAGLGLGERLSVEGVGGSPGCKPLPVEEPAAAVLSFGLQPSNYVKSNPSNYCIKNWKPNFQTRFLARVLLLLLGIASGGTRV